MDVINLCNTKEEYHGCICILSNSDIIYDEKTTAHFDSLDKQEHGKCVFAVTRWNCYTKKLEIQVNKPSVGFSFDSYGFIAPLKIKNVLDYDISFGVGGCDNYLISKFYKDDICVMNPCYDIITIHVDSATRNTRQTSNYYGRKDYPHVYKGVPITFLETEKSEPKILGFKKVVSFSLWHTNNSLLNKDIGECIEKNHYIEGIFNNAKDIMEKYPDWEMWIYADKSTIPITVLRKHFCSTFNHVKFIEKDSKTDYKKSLWRFEALSDEVEIFISRDLDSRILDREVDAVEEWLTSSTDENLHIMRDHPDHKCLILAGMFGIKRTNLHISTSQWNKNIADYKTSSNNWFMDQDFLKDSVYYTHLDNKSMMVHTDFVKYPQELARDINIKPFRVAPNENYEYIGGYSTGKKDSGQAIRFKQVYTTLKSYSERFKEHEFYWNLDFIGNDISKLGNILNSESVGDEEAFNTLGFVKRDVSAKKLVIVNTYGNFFGIFIKK